MTNTTIGRTGSLWRLLAVALVMVLACGSLALALTARPSEAALRAFDGGAVSSGDGDYATHPANAAAIPIPAGEPSSLYREWQGRSSRPAVQKNVSSRANF